MTLVPTIIADTAEYTVTVDVDSVTGDRSNERLVYKPGTVGANVATIRSRSDQAIADIQTARALIAGGGAKWDNLTPGQRTAILDGLLVDMSGVIRWLSQRFEATT